MNTLINHKFELKGFSSETDTRVSVNFQATPGKLDLLYRIQTNQQSIVWPEFDQPSRADGLWKSTCLELFIGDADEPSYYELNLSPSGAWNCFSFSDYRTGMAQSDRLSPGVWQPDSLSLGCQLDCIPPIETGMFTLGLSCVLDYGNNQLEYFSLGHGSKPDFHARDLHTSLTFS